MTVTCPSCGGGDVRELPQHSTSTHTGYKCRRERCGREFAVPTAFGRNQAVLSLVVPALLGGGVAFAAAHLGGHHHVAGIDLGIS